MSGEGGMNESLWYSNYGTVIPALGKMEGASSLVPRPGGQESEQGSCGGGSQAPCV